MDSVYKKRFNNGYHLTKTDKVYVGILQGDHVIKFVTAVKDKWAEWKDGEPALEMCLNDAGALMQGLCLNGHHAIIIDALYLEGLGNAKDNKEKV